MLLWVTVIIVLYNLYRKNYEKEYGQPLVKLQPLKKGEFIGGKNAGVNGISKEEGGEAEEEKNEDDDFKREFSVDGDINAAVDNLGTNVRKFFYKREKFASLRLA
uniref:Uncharacterized protein n=1 Tax=Panagrolaimus sp. ES5 TaxID=591445 RepID=A0AC34G2F8_9BILA